MGRSRCSATVADAIGPVAGDQDNVVGIATARGDVAAREFAGAPRQSSVVAGSPADSVLHAAAVPVATVVAARCPDCDSSHLDPARLGFDRHPVDDASLAVAAAAAGVVVPNHDSTVATVAAVPAVAVLPIADDPAPAVGHVGVAVPSAALVLDSAVAGQLNAVVALATAVGRVDVAAPSAAVVLDFGVADQLNAVVALATAVGRVAVAAPSAAVVLDSGVADQLNAVVALATAVGRVAAAVPNAAVDLDSAAVALVPVGCVVRLAAGPVQIDVLPVDSVVPVAVVPLRPGSAGFARHLVRVFPGPQRDQMRPAVRRINWLTLQAV